MKREVLITQSMERFVEARNRLSGAGIPYKTKIVDSGGLGRTIGARTNLLGRAGEHTEFSTQYYIYVPKGYEQRARHVINEK